MNIVRLCQVLLISVRLIPIGKKKSIVQLSLPTIQSVLWVYLDLRGKSKEAIENGAASKSLTEIRSWFLSAYPQVAQFHEKREQEMMRLKAEKEKKRAEEKAKAFDAHINHLLQKTA